MKTRRERKRENKRIKDEINKKLPRLKNKKEEIKKEHSLVAWIKRNR